MSEHRWLALILVLYLLFGLGYSVLMPIWEAPDEPGHYQYALYIARVGTVPPPFETNEAHQPPLYYWMASWPLRLLDAINPVLADYHAPPWLPEQSLRRYDWTAENYKFLFGPHLLRWLNLLLGAATLFLIHQGTDLFVPDSPEIPMATIALAGLTPQFVHISASVSNDALANLAGAFLFWLLGLVCAGRLDRRSNVLTIIVALAFPFLTKLTVLPVGLSVAAAVAWRTRANWWSRWYWLLAGGLASGLILAAGSFLLAPALANRVWRDVWWRGLYVRPDAFGPEGPSFESIRAALGFLSAHFAWSYWGIVGWVAVRLPRDAWLFMTSLAALGWLSNLSLVRKQWMEKKDSQLISRWIPRGLLVVLAATLTWWLASIEAPIGILGLWALGLAWWGRQLFVNRAQEQGRMTALTWSLLWITATLTILAAAKNVLATAHGVQGRFLFPSIGVLSLLITSGWLVLLPPRLTRYLPHMVLLLMIALNFLLWFGRVLPVYYQPILG